MLALRIGIDGEANQERRQQVENFAPRARCKSSKGHGKIGRE